MTHRDGCRILIVGLASVFAVCFDPSSTFAEDRDHEHFMIQAIRRGDGQLLKDLLDRGTPADVRDPEGTTPLMYAALHGSVEMVKLLLDHGANARAANDRGVTPLLWGARDPEKVLMLISRGANVNARSALGNTPLMVAAAAPNGASSVEQLLAHGAEITPKNKRGSTALRNAASGGDLRTVRLLLAKAREQGTLEEVIAAAGPIVANAASNGFHEMVQVLLENGADPNLPNGSRGHGLNAALLAGNTEIARTLISSGADLNCLTQPHDVPTVVLAAYTELDDPSILQVLKEHDADFSAANRDAQTALTWARMRGHRRLIDSLLEAETPEGELPSRPEVPSNAIGLHAGNRSRLITEAVQKSIDLLQLSSETFLDVRRNCVSCHHQNLPSVAMAWARDRGFRVRQPPIDRMIERQVKSWAPRIDRTYELDSPFPVPPRFLGYGMWGFAELGFPPDELTRAVTWYLAETQQPDGRWIPGMLRPPMGDGEILATTLAMRSLQLYPLTGREEETTGRIERARRWLEQAKPRTHQERVFRMLGLSWAGVESIALVGEVQSLLDAQRDDGGWAQLEGLTSDAWATGQTLVALHIAGGLSTVHPAYARGIEMLLSTQFDDGSWFVQSRSWPFQAYFESHFPYGRDQWISAPATAWAVMALVLAIEPNEVILNSSIISDSPLQREQPAPSTTGATPIPPAATRPVDFAQDIEPLFARSCRGCHGKQDAKANFSVTSRSALIRGGDSELPAIVPGSSQDSPLVRFAAGAMPMMEMPPLAARDKYPPLSEQEVSLLRAWVDQGAVWASDADATNGK